MDDVYCLEVVQFLHQTVEVVGALPNEMETKLAGFLTLKRRSLQVER